MSNVPNQSDTTQQPANLDLKSKKNRRKYLDELAKLCQDAEKQIQEGQKKFEAARAFCDKTQKEYETAHLAIEKRTQEFAEDKTKYDKWLPAIETCKAQSEELFGEISDFHAVVFGQIIQVPGKPGTETRGLKDDLEDAYNELRESFKKLGTDFTQFQKDKNDVFTKSQQDHETRFESIHAKIESLLPGALSAGLSSAFQKKREAIQRTQKWHYACFLVSILALTVWFGYTFLATSTVTTIETFGIVVVRNLLIASPVLWLAIFINRKLNLSTRLIEEYSHKETVSKTFEGLAKEIQKLEEDDAAIRLQRQLLQTTLDVNSANPGKLVKGYDTIDHPIALLQQLVSMKKIPGFDFSKFPEIIVALNQNGQKPFADTKTETEEDT